MSSEVKNDGRKTPVSFREMVRTQGPLFRRILAHLLIGLVATGMAAIMSEKTDASILHINLVWGLVHGAAIAFQVGGWSVQREALSEAIREKSECKQRLVLCERSLATAKEGRNHDMQEAFAILELCQQRQGDAADNQALMHVRGIAGHILVRYLFDYPSSLNDKAFYNDLAKPSFDWFLRAHRAQLMKLAKGRDLLVAMGERTGT